MNTGQPQRVENCMKKIAPSKIGFLLSTALLGALSGCVGHVDQPQARGGYYQESSAPEEVYVSPASVQVEATDGTAGVSIRSESDFYEPLTPYGRWEVVGSYGRCWIPGRVEADWRPYCEGYWQRTDAGWYWVSDEPWAWATYHYGCWDLSPEYGWYWVPQTQWAPAWVSWHSGGGYIGWTPRYPSGAREISPRAYVFVEERHFTEPVRRSTLVVNNTTIINQSVINQAPSTALVEKASGRKVQALPVLEVRHKGEAAVVAQRSSPAAISEKRVQPPVRNEAPPAQGKAVAEHQSVAPAPKNPEARTQKPKTVLATAIPSPVVNPKSNHASAMREPTRQGTDKHFEKPAAPAKERPATKQNNEPTTADKNHENKAKE
jgi:hypothetical protein